MIAQKKNLKIALNQLTTDIESRAAFLHTKPGRSGVVLWRDELKPMLELKSFIEKMISGMTEDEIKDPEVVVINQVKEEAPNKPEAPRLSKIEEVKFQQAAELKKAITGK